MPPTTPDGFWAGIVYSLVSLALGQFRNLFAYFYVRYWTRGASGSEGIMMRVFGDQLMAAMASSNAFNSTQLYLCTPSSPGSTSILGDPGSPPSGIGTLADRV